MRHFPLLAIAALCALPTQAQETAPKLKIGAETKVGFYNDRVGGELRHDHSGFKGDQLNVFVDGQINEKVSFAFRQRLNKKIERNDIFQATDWMYVTYQANKNWGVSAGKEIVWIGGYEYEKAPIDVYTASEFWNNVTCFKFGVNGAYTSNSGNDTFFAQFCESSFATADRHDMFAYNLYWTGTHGIWSTTYSLNMMEYEPSKFISYIALGNRFNMGPVTLELDLMNRVASHQTYFFKDCSVMANLIYGVIPMLNIYGKVTYDVNKTDTDADKYVMAGSELTTVSGGLEFFPVKNKKNFRVNLGVAHTSGKNTNPDGTMLNDRLTIQAGVSAKLDLFKMGY